MGACAIEDKVLSTMTVIFIDLGQLWQNRVHFRS